MLVIGAVTESSLAHEYRSVGYGPTAGVAFVNCMDLTPLSLPPITDELKLEIELPWE
jgi:hypothetical protein